MHLHEWFYVSVIVVKITFMYYYNNLESNRDRNVRFYFFYIYKKRKINEKKTATKHKTTKNNQKE